MPVRQHPIAEDAMSPTLLVSRRKATYAVTIVVLLGFAASVSADPKPLSKAEQAKVDKAVEKGIAYLRRNQTKEGNWPTHYKNRYLVGECALPAYALLEAGVPANDPAIQKAAAFIRPKALKTDETYELSLVVLFLDRLGDPKDKKLIQSLALRLIAGQYRTGGWSYRCFKLSESQESDLLRLLGELNKLMKEGGKSTKEAVKELEVPRKLKALTAFQDLERFNWQERASPRGSRESLPLLGLTDNSNTQFALLALWVAQQYGIPTEPTFRLQVKRFERSQCPNGQWDYPYVNTRDSAPSNRTGYPSMICVGLLGLAIGEGLKLPNSPSFPPLGQGDHRILTGLAALYSTIGVPTGQMDKPVPTEDIYFLWSLERVGMLFNLPTLGDKEWYRWGAEILVTNQFATGEFDTGDRMKDRSIGVNSVRGYYGPILKSSFALLFLKHSHPMKDLTPKLPFTAKELNQGITRLRPSAKSLDRPMTVPESGSRNRTTAVPDGRNP
jgi:hypothetical protein